MSAFVLRGKSNSHIFTIDRGIVARENASDNVNILDQDYAQNLGILLAVSYTHLTLPTTPYV